VKKTEDVTNCPCGGKKYGYKNRPNLSNHIEFYICFKCGKFKGAALMLKYDSYILMQKLN